jgi:cullin-associated NEDD8-dissociated protein 1
MIRSILKDGLLKQLCDSTRQEQWYKNIAEALKALSFIPAFFQNEPDSAAISQQIFDPIEPLLAAHDVDQEIKECAMKAAAALLVVSKLETDQSNRLLTLLLERLKNESTRIVAIKTISTIAYDGCDLSPILVETILTMASFMEYTSRSLKQAALEALAVLMQKHGGSIIAVNSNNNHDATLFAKIVGYVVALFTDRDLHLCHLSLYVHHDVVDDRFGSCITDVALSQPSGDRSSGIVSIHRIGSASSASRLFGQPCLGTWIGVGNLKYVT